MKPSTDLLTGLPTPDSDSIYGYRPTEWIAILFVVLFSISTLLHVVEATRYKIWFMFPTAVLAGILEITGWSGRLWSSLNLFAFQPFQMQIVTTIMAPTPLVAANFMILGQIIRILGPAYSRLSPHLYTLIFTCCDVVSLVVQGVGGGLASAEADGGNPDTGGNVMLGGIVFQLVTITVYMLCSSEFLVRYALDKPFNRANKRDSASIEYGTGYSKQRGVVTKEVKTMICALVFSSICLYIRSIYRTIELSDGWTGRIITTQVYFNVLDGAMIVLAIYTLNIVHPCTLKEQELEHKPRIGNNPIPSMTEI